MYTSIYQNSYIIAIISFIVLCLIFYFFEIGYVTTMVDGKIVKKFSWKYPLAISLIIWLVWYFCLFPPKNDINNSTDYGITTSPRNYVPANKLLDQKINMNNWN